MVTKFSKYHGTGNDFILIDDRKDDFHKDEKLIQHLCDRRYGIGADGLILLNYENGYDFNMTYFNSDGKSGSMCGNGGRCIVAFANNLNIIHKKAKFLTSDGLHEAQILGRDKDVLFVKLKMQDVKSVEMDNDSYIINTGSPHYINFVTGLDQMDIFNEGRKIRNNEVFKTDGINVDFVEVNKDHLFVRTYERGVENETLSCGTGVIASALAYALKCKKDEFVNIQTKGGNLKVMFKRYDNTFADIWLEGPASFVFSGNIQV